MVAFLACGCVVERERVIKGHYNIQRVSLFKQCSSPLCSPADQRNEEINMVYLLFVVCMFMQG